MVPGFQVKYAVFDFKMSSQVKFDPAILTSSKKPSQSQNLKSLAQKTRNRCNNVVTRRFGRYSQIIPKEFPKKPKQFPNNSDRISKEFQQNFQRIFKKIPKKYPIAYKLPTRAYWSKSFSSLFFQALLFLCALGTYSFKALRLFFLPNFLGPKSIPESRVSK